MKTAIASSSLVIATLTLAADNLVINGSFEAGGQLQCVTSCTSGLQGWSFAGSCSIDWVRRSACPDPCDPIPAGTSFIDLSGSPGHGSLWQTMSVTPDTAYRLAFAVGANCEGGTATKHLRVLINGSATDFFVTCLGFGCFEWHTVETIDFTAANSVVEIRFMSVPPGNPAHGPLIDDVRVTAIHPDPCTGDLNDDGIVNGADISIMLGFWGLNGKPVDADINGDGLVDGADLAMLLSSWGKCP